MLVRVSIRLGCAVVNLVSNSTGSTTFAPIPTCVVSGIFSFYGPHSFASKGIIRSIERMTWCIVSRLQSAPTPYGYFDFLCLPTYFPEFDLHATHQSTACFCLRQHTHKILPLNPRSCSSLSPSPGSPPIVLQQLADFIAMDLQQSNRAQLFLLAKGGKQHEHWYVDLCSN